MKFSTSVLQTITPAQAIHYKVIPFEVEEGVVSMYISDQENLKEVKKELQLVTTLSVELVPMGEQKVLEHINTEYRLAQDTSSYYDTALKIEGDFLDTIISEARRTTASDIHIEKYEKRARVRLRIDGSLIERYVVKEADYPSLINKIKIASKLNISEKRLPQDGRILWNKEGENIDIRVSTTPSIYGEKVVMRVLQSSASEVDLEKLGMNADQKGMYDNAIRKTNGIILISGPTGSGKTTTLYATLKKLNKTTNNILTIENPVEYVLEGVNQVQLKEDIGLTYPVALKSFLRQDPDIIMLGEIRDYDTAMMAVQASLTGHLVLSTIHTNSAIGTLSRLVNLGIPEHIIRSTLKVSVAQRLIRKLCSCKKSVGFDPSELPLGFSPKEKPTEQYVPVGCPTCFNTGYKGRLAIYEMLDVSDLPAEHTDMSTFKQVNSLSDNAWQKFVEGETSLEEVYPHL